VFFRALIGTLVTTLVGKPLVRLNFEQKKPTSAWCGFAKMQKRSPLPGRRAESNNVKQRFLEAFDNVKRLLIWELNLNVLTNAYEFIPFILPPW